MILGTPKDYPTKFSIARILNRKELYCLGLEIKTKPGYSPKIIVESFMQFAEMTSRHVFFVRVMFQKSTDPFEMIIGLGPNMILR